MKIRPVDEDTARRAVELWDENPDRTLKEISDMLKEEGFKATVNVVRFVLLAYRGHLE